LWCGLDLADCDRGIEEWLVKFDKPVVAIPPGGHTATEVFLELLEVTGLAVEKFASWSSAGYLRQLQWRSAAGLLEDKPGLDAAALFRFGATYDLVERLADDRFMAHTARAYFNPLGGELPEEHEVEGFNDLAWAAARLAELGLRVALVDLDAHHASANEALLLDRPEVLTISLHSASSRATTESNTEGNFNFVLAPGAQDAGFVMALQGAVGLLAGLDQLDVLIVGGGADGLDSDSSSDLALSSEAFDVAGHLLGKVAAGHGASVLLGGGSGSLPHDGTPGAWLSLFAGLSSSMVLSSS
jgi:acetoin utilization deacetylase AcuC-like enzyme